MVDVWLILAGGVTSAIGVGVAWYAWRRRSAFDPGRREVENLGTEVALKSTARRGTSIVEQVISAANGDSSRLCQCLEEELVARDLGVGEAAAVVSGVRDRLGRSIGFAELEASLRTELESVLGAAAAIRLDCRPWVVLVVGVNGAGKTTTLGKLAALYHAAGRSVLFVAGDTFRAAATVQLVKWGNRVGVDTIRGGANAKPAAVVFDGLKAAVARDVDVVLVDTAGRLHTREHLMGELRKIREIAQREIPGAPHEVLLVVDATTGQNALAQVRTFAQAIGITGIVVTKLDGTARGGVVFVIRREMGVPIRYVGTGEGVGDIQPFDPVTFVQRFVGAEEPASDKGRRSIGT